MKPFSIVLLFSCFCLVECNRRQISSFHSVEEVQVNQRKTTKLRKVEMKCFRFVHGEINKMPLSEEMFEYDTSGKIIRKISNNAAYYDEPLPFYSSITNYYYDWDGSLQKKKVVGDVIRSDSVSTNNFRDSSQTVYEYDEHKRLTKEKYYMWGWLSSVETYQYDKLGNVINWSYFKAKYRDSSLFLERWKKYRYQRNENKRIAYWEGGGGLYSLTEYIFHWTGDSYLDGDEKNWRKYNSNGFLIEEGGIKRHTVYEYKFDGLGNPLEKIHITTDGVKYRIYTYRNEYY
ncbi:MAG: hypothetical protein EPO24_00100 [Bacteroidetes bacterium]|nr:MAG: hypothetical protein EPO24_00100 [Bacteroidota bacterium]